MSNVLERRIEHFQHKVQQSVILADDEIGRLSEDLQSIKGEINEVKDQLNKVDIQLNQSEQASKGRKQREIAKGQLKIANVKIQNEKELKEIVLKHRAEMGSLQKDYQNSLAQLELWASKREAQRTAPLDVALKKIEEQMQQTKETMSVAEKTAIDDASAELEEVQVIENNRLNRLEGLVKDKNNERLNQLLSAKARLSDCVNTLEEMERNHSLTMSSYQGKLNEIDSNYNQRAKRMQDICNREVASLKRKLIDAQKKDETTRDMIEKIQHNQKRQIYSAVREGEDLRLQMQTLGAEPVYVAAEDNEHKQQSELFEKLKKKLADRENQLIQARTENESMKREICRLQHEAKRRNVRRSIY